MNKISILHPNIEMDEFIVMPNHIHAIIIVGNAIIESSTDRTKMVLSKIVQQFKRACSIKIRINGLPVSNGRNLFTTE